MDLSKKYGSINLTNTVIIMPADNHYKVTIQTQTKHNRHLIMIFIRPIQLDYRKFKVHVLKYNKIG